MGYDENIISMLIVLSSSQYYETQLMINADQENKFNIEEVIKAINNVEDLIKGMEDDNSKSILNQNLDNIKNEIKQKHTKKEVLTTSFKRCILSLLP